MTIRSANTTQFKSTVTVRFNSLNYITLHTCWVLRYCTSEIYIIEASWGAPISTVLKYSWQLHYTTWLSTFFELMTLDWITNDNKLRMEIEFVKYQFPILSFEYQLFAPPVTSRFSIFPVMISASQCSNIPSRHWFLLDSFTYRWSVWKGLSRVMLSLMKIGVTVMLKWKV